MKSSTRTKHTCPCILVHCIDFRFQGTIDKLIRSLGYNPGDFDRVSVAGGAGNFEILKHHAPLSKRLHDPEMIILTVHEDCGAGAKKEDLMTAKKIVSETIPHARCFFLKLDGSWEEML